MNSEREDSPGGSSRWSKLAIWIDEGSTMHHSLRSESLKKYFTKG
jgi:hypothetical protein